MVVKIVTFSEGQKRQLALSLRLRALYLLPLRLSTSLLYRRRIGRNVKMKVMDVHNNASQGSPNLRNSLSLTPSLILAAYAR
jgi:hypothetical protein